MDFFSTISPDGDPIFLASLPNERGGRTHHEFACNEEHVQKFLAAYDRPGRALYFTVAHLSALPEGEPLVGVSGSWRCKENVQTVSWIWAEVDCKDHPELTPEEIRRRIDAIPLKPTMIVSSGHGFHLY